MVRRPLVHRTSGAPPEPAATAGKLPETAIRTAMAAPRPLTSEQLQASAGHSSHAAASGDTRANTNASFAPAFKREGLLARARLPLSEKAALR